MLYWHQEDFLLGKQYSPQKVGQKDEAGLISADAK